MTRSHQFTAVLQAASELWSVPCGEILGTRRPESMVAPRHAAMAFLHDEFGWTYKDVADAFGRPSHSIVMWAVKQVENRRRTSRTFDAMFRELERCVSGEEH